MEKIIVAFGGNSFEHDISVVTASQIFARTKLESYMLIALYFSRDGKMYLYENNKFDIKDFSRKNFNGESKKFKEVVIVSCEKNKLFTKSKWGLKEVVSAEVVLCAFHGNDGENGKIISVLENVGFKCSAGNVLALATCMNKYIFKQVMKGIRIPTVSGFLIKKNELENKKYIDSRLARLKFPVILKSNNGGSSIGVFVAKNEDEFYEKLKIVFEFDNEVLVEKFIEQTREFNIAILGNYENFELSNIDEPLKSNELYSFADKYTSNKKGKGENKISMFQNIQKISLDKDLKEKIEKMAKSIFMKLNLYGVVRIDFLFDKTNNKLYVCEVNAIPGSLGFYFFAKGRFLINDFVLKLIEITRDSKNNEVKINQDLVVDILD